MIGTHEAGRVTEKRLAVLRDWQPRVTLLFNEALHDTGKVRAALPHTFLVGRVYKPDEEVHARISADPRAAAHWAAHLIAEAVAYAPHIDVWQIANEIAQTSPGLIRKNAQFHVTLMRLLADAGLRAAIGGFSVGNPHLPAHEHMQFWQEFYPAMEEALRLDGVLLLHAYGAPRMHDTDPDWYLHRYERQVLPRLPEHLQALPYLYGEYGADLGINNIAPKKGWKTGYNGDYRSYGADLHKAALFLARYPQCLGAAIYTHGCENCGDWGDFDITGEPARHLARLDWPDPIQVPPLPEEPPMNNIPRITETQHAHHWSSRDGEPVTHLVLHGADDPNQGSVHTTAAYLAGNNAAGVSSHECVGYDPVTQADYVYLLLPADKAAHTVGRSRLPGGARGQRANQRSYNIEAQHHKGLPMHPRTRALLIERAVAFCVAEGWSYTEIVERAQVVGHYEIDTRGKTCPGVTMFGHMDTVRREIAERVAALHAPVQTAKVRWALEEAARILQREGMQAEHDYILDSDLYKGAA